MAIQIAIKCQGADCISLDELKNFQGSLKKSKKANIARLKQRIIEDGWTAPIFIWKHDGENYILDGHQRKTAIDELVSEGYSIDYIPVDYIEAEDEKDARKKLLSIASQYGEWQKEELDIWLEEVGKSVADTLRLVNEEVKDKEESQDQESKTIKLGEKIEVIVEVQDEGEAEELYSELQGRGLTCRVSTL